MQIGTFQPNWITIFPRPIAFLASKYVLYFMHLDNPLHTLLCRLNFHNSAIAKLLRDTSTITATVPTVLLIHLPPAYKKRCLKSK